MATPAETAGETGAEPDVEDEELGEEVLFMAEVKSPNGLGNPGHKAGGTPAARLYRACCCWWAAIKACNCCASKLGDLLDNVLDVCANIMETAMRAFSAIKLLFCSLALAAAVVAAVLEEPGFEPATPLLAATAAATAAASLLAVAAEVAAANKGELRNNMAAVDGSNNGGGGPGGGPKPIIP